MTYLERVGNIHIHTTYSDGTGTHDEVAVAAAQAGLDFLVVTDHNAYVPEQAGWRSGVLVLVGEEVHNPARPGVNHLLVLGAGEDLAPLAGDTQAVVDAVRARGGLAFIAHPFERPGRVVAESAINWVDWQVRGYTGLEIWNYMSELKGRLYGMAYALVMAYLPQIGMLGPFPETLQKWDALLADGPVYAIGGADAHAEEYSLGPLRKRVFGYRHLFGAVNTHVLVSGEWTGSLAEDGDLVYEALARGRGFVAYDALADARGFRFEVLAEDSAWPMGSIVPAQPGLRLRATAPAEAELRLLRNGHVVAEGSGTELEYADPAPGAYRLEAYRRWYLRRRGWIFSNPILVRPA